MGITRSTVDEVRGRRARGEPLTIVDARGTEFDAWVRAGQPVEARAAAVEA
jgi:hypothetical protein